MAKSQRRLNAENQIRQAKAQVLSLKRELNEERSELKRIVNAKAQSIRVTKSNISQTLKDIKQTQLFINKQTKALKDL